MRSSSGSDATAGAALFARAAARQPCLNLHTHSLVRRFSCTVAGTASMRSSPAAMACASAGWKWPAPGSEDIQLGALMELKVGHGETEVYAGGGAPDQGSRRILCAGVARPGRAYV